MCTILNDAYKVLSQIIFGYCWRFLFFFLKDKINLTVTLCVNYFAVLVPLWIGNKIMTQYVIDNSSINFQTSVHSH